MPSCFAPRPRRCGTIAADLTHLGAEIGFFAVLHTLGADAGPSSSSALRRARGRPVPRWHPLDRLPPRLLPARPGALAPVSPAAAPGASGRVRRGVTPLRRDPRGPGRSPGLCRSPHAGAPDRLGCVRETAIRRNRLRSSTTSDATLTLTAREFIRRFLLHVLPPGFHRIRYYGFLGNRHRTEKLARCWRLLDTDATPPAPTEGPPRADYRDSYEALTGRSLRRCPVCHGGHMILVEAISRARPALTDTS